MKFNTVTLLFIGAITTSQAIKLEHKHHHHHEGHILGKTNGGGGKRSHAQLDCVNDPNQATCDQYVPTALSDVTISKNQQKKQEMNNFKSLLDQRLAEHKGEREDKDEDPLPIESKGSNKDIEYKLDAWDSHFPSHNRPHGENGFRSHAESNKGDQIEEMMDSKAYAQKEKKKEHHKGKHHHHHSQAQSEADDKDDNPLCVKPTQENMIKFMDQFSRTFQKADYDKAMEIAGELKVKPPRVTAWELMDKSFTFPRVRNYELVKEQMDVVEHYEDNLNVNLSNQKAVLAFIENATAAHAALKEKYPDAANGWNDPADPINIPDSEKTE